MFQLGKTVTTTCVYTDYIVFLNVDFALVSEYIYLSEHHVDRIARLLHKTEKKSKTTFERKNRPVFPGTKS